MMLLITIINAAGEYGDIHVVFAVVAAAAAERCAAMLGSSTITM